MRTLICVLLTACSAPSGTDPEPELPAQVLDPCTCLEVDESSSRCLLFWAAEHVPPGECEPLECDEFSRRACHVDPVSWWWLCGRDGMVDWAWAYSDEFGEYVDSVCAEVETENEEG